MPPARKEIERLLAQARSDRENAEKVIKVGAHDVAAFLCHPAVDRVAAARRIWEWLEERF